MKHSTQLFLYLLICCSFNLLAQDNNQPCAEAPSVPNLLLCEGESTVISPGGSSIDNALIWEETFSEDGAGVSGVCSGPNTADCATDQPPSNGQWSVTGDVTGLTATSDFFLVNAGQLVAQDVDATICFTTQIIDISSFSGVSFSADITESGDHEAADFIDVSYVIDGGTPVLVPNWMGLGDADHTLVGDIPDDGDFGSTTVSVEDLSGSSLVIEICVLNNAGSEQILLDNISVSGTPVLTRSFNFYDADPDAGPGANLLAENVTSFDPGTTPATSPQTIFVTELGPDCESPADEVQITVNALPEASFTAPADVCADFVDFIELEGMPAGGFFSGPGVSRLDTAGGTNTFVFFPAAVGVGTTTITYTVFDNSTECENSVTDDIEVFALPEVTLTLDPAVFCASDADGQTVGGGAPTGGVYSGENVIDDGNGTTFTFNPATAGTGDVSVTYTFTDENGCTGSATATVSVQELPSAPEVADVFVCEGEATVIEPTQITPEPILFWEERFDEADAGVTGACEGSEPASCAVNNAPSNGQWSLTGDFSGITAASDYFRTEEGALTARDVDTEVCFLSQPIDISGFTSVDFSAQIDETGDHEGGDYVDVSLIVDGTPMLITNFMNLGNDDHTLVGDIPDDMDWGSTAVTAAGLSGGILQVEICVLNNAGSEFILLDDITLTGTPVPVTFNFYDANPGEGDANLLAGNVSSFDPGTTAATSPDTVFVTMASEPCESEAAGVIVSVEAVPELACPDTIRVMLDADGVGSVDFDALEFSFAASELCAPEDTTRADAFTLNCTSGDSLVENAILVTFASGATSGCDVLILLEDEEAPVIEANDTTLFLDENGLASLAIADFADVVSDNCESEVTDIFRVEDADSDDFTGADAGAKFLDRILEFTCDDLGNVNLRVEIVATDAFGNESRDTITVTVLDTIAPVISCVSDTVYLDATGEVADAPGENVTIEADNCPPGMIVGSPLQIFTCDQVGINEFTETRTDESGNESEPCTFTVTVLDTIAPELTITPADVTLDLDGTAMLTVPDLAVAADACSIASVTAERLDFGCDDIGLVFVEVTATDVNGNVTVASTPVTVDFEQPQFACIDEINVTLDEACSFTLIPAQFITGNTACLDAFDFDIVVMDADTSNGPVIDGCGRFNYVIRSVGVGILDLDFETCWGIVNAEDKTPPAVEETPADVELLCVDIDDNNVSALPSSVSHCYEVFSATGATVPNTMDPALNRALRAGGTTPLVPLFTDACTEKIEVCVNDVLVYAENDPECNDAVLTRTFTATEIAICPGAAGEANESVTAGYVINFTRPTLDDINDDNIDLVVEFEQCGVVNPTRADYPAPRPEDFPFLVVGDRTFPLTADEGICNIVVSYEDSRPFQTCPYTYKFFRTYTVFDWCVPGERREFIQTVKVGDTTPPDFFGPTQDRDFDGIVDGDLLYTTNAGRECAAFIRLDGAGVRAVDECDPDVTITAQIFPGGDLSATPIGSFDVDPNDGDAEVTSAIPVGCHLLRYTSVDACDNVTISDFDFCVEDGTAPVAICEDGLNIGITSGSATDGTPTGIAVLTPEMLDNGSYDDCSDITLSIARVDGANLNTEPYDDQIILTCADLGVVRVGLRVSDGTNENFCWLDVLVEDKVAPTCIPPGPVRLSCIEYNETLPADITESTVDERNAVFGSAAGVDNCEVTITETISGDVNSCGVGSFTRTFTATDGQGFTNQANCRQRITVYGVHDYQLIFPADAEAGCATVPDYEEIQANELACDLITTTTDVDTLRTLEAGEECFKLRVTYDVINWCEYGTLGQPYLIPRDGDGIRNPETQLLYLNVLPVDVNTTTDDFAFLSRFSDRVYNPAPNAQNDQLLDDGDDMDGSDDDNGNDNIDDDAYAADASRGHFRYIQFIKVYDEEAPTIMADEPADCFGGAGENCEAIVNLTFTARDECSDITPLLELDANYVAANGFSADNAGALGIGGLMAVDQGDGKYAINLTGVPVGNHAIRIRANDGCGNFDVEILEFCVSADKAPTPICINQLTVTLMPDGNAGGMAEIWASDFIASDVEDCFGNVIDKYSIYTEEEAQAVGFAPVVGRLGIDFDCESDATIPVRVYAIDDNGAADYCSVIVLVQLNNPDMCEQQRGVLSGAITTDAATPVADVSVTLTGANDMDVTMETDVNGVFVFNGLEQGVDYTVQPNYQAAVNLSHVKTSDVVKISSVILGAGDFDSPYDYLAADVDLDGTINVLDLVAIQRVILGLDDTFRSGQTWGFVRADVDVDVAEDLPNVYNINDFEQNVLGADFRAWEFGNVIGEGRSAVTLEVEDAFLAAGQTHTMTLDGRELRGFQGTLELAAGLELLNADYTGEGGLNLNYLADGMLALALRAGATLEVEVRATTAGRLSELVQLTDAITLREGVGANGNGGVLNLAFVHSLAPATAPNALHQNTPNPVTSETLIRYELAVAGSATLVVRDVAGRQLLTRRMDATAGTNSVRLTAAELGASGVLTYTLTSGDFTATRKLIVTR